MPRFSSGVLLRECFCLSLNGSLSVIPVLVDFQEKNDLLGFRSNSLQPTSATGDKGFT